MKQIIDDGFIAMLEARDLMVKNPMNGLFGGNRRSQSYGSSAEFADFREYAPGDDLRRIDWNLYARFEKLYLKLFVDERQLHHRIYIDSSASMDWGEPNKAHMALKLAAALGFLAVQSMDRVSFYSLQENTCRDLCRTVVGREAFYNAANTLNRVRFFGDSDVGAAFASLEDIGHGDGLSILISDFLTDSDWKSAVDKLLYHNREVCLIQVLSRDEIAPGFSGKVLMLDSERIDEDDERNFRSEITRTSMKAYAEAFAWHQKELKDFCAARNVSFMTVCSDESIERMLFMKATEVGLIQ
ncbi:MAG: DUF58 domain-containing protein [Oscillospiraceae bacterium]|nr:DUF58 domain-containing protein [Oscillospiraceae bacterium]